jgi:hypothetical protein
LCYVSWRRERQGGELSKGIYVRGQPEATSCDPHPLSTLPRGAAVLHGLEALPRGAAVLHGRRDPRPKLCPAPCRGRGATSGRRCTPVYQRRDAAAPTAGWLHFTWKCPVQIDGVGGPLHTVACTGVGCTSYVLTYLPPSSDVISYRQSAVCPAHSGLLLEGLQVQLIATYPIIPYVYYM